MDEEWWQANLRELNSKKKEQERLETLTTMYTKIKKQSALPRNILESLLEAPALYDCAVVKDAAKEPLVNMSTDVIGSCFDQLQLDTSDAQLPKLLEPAFHHSNPALRAIVLNNLLKELRRQTSASNVLPLPNNELLVYVLDELQQPETLCSSVAISILTILLSQWLTDLVVLGKLVELVQQNEVIRCRVYELCVVLAKRSAYSLSCVEFVLDAALKELNNDDVLLQANVMEILVPLAEQNHGLHFLERRQILDVISSRVQCSFFDKPLDALLIPSIMKLFGKIAAVQPQKIIAGYPRMLTCLFDLLQSGDETILPTAMDTLANLACSIQGKTLMHRNFERDMGQALRKYAEYTKSLSPLLKIRMLNSLDVIYTMESPVSNELSTILKNWYECFAGGQQVDHIKELLQTPFPDMQLAALGLLKTLCQYGWGITAVQRTAGAVEFLLSRQIDLHKDVKYLKWQIMEMLSVSSEFTASETVRFTAYVNEGPYHIRSDVNIATESQGNH